MQDIRTARPRHLTDADLLLAMAYAHTDNDNDRFAVLAVERERRWAAVLATFNDPFYYRDADGRLCVRERRALTEI